MFLRGKFAGKFYEGGATPSHFTAVGDKNRAIARIGIEFGTFRPKTKTRLLDGGGASFLNSCKKNYAGRSSGACQHGKIQSPEKRRNKIGRAADD